MKIRSEGDSLVFSPECDSDVLLIGKMYSSMDMELIFETTGIVKLHMLKDVIIHRDNLVKFLNDKI